MNNKFNINKEKTINSILFVLSNLGGQCDFHKIFKILYFADQKHLVLYGTQITGDYYIAMKDGPVPSKTYDMFKSVRGESWGSRNHDYDDFFEIDSHYFAIQKRAVDFDELSQSEIECLESSIKENKDLDFTELSNKSHSTAWINTSRDNEMNLIDIAVEGGANEEMKKYILINIENQNPLRQYAVR